MHPLPVLVPRRRKGNEDVSTPRKRVRTFAVTQRPGIPRRALSSTAARTSEPGPVPTPPSRGANNILASAAWSMATTATPAGSWTTTWPPNGSCLPRLVLPPAATLADAGACEQTCLDAIWEAGALRMVDICAHKSDDDPNTRLAREATALSRRRQLEPSQRPPLNSPAELGIDPCRRPLLLPPIRHLRASRRLETSPDCPDAHRVAQFAAHSRLTRCATTARKPPSNRYNPDQVWPAPTSGPAARSTPSDRVRHY